MKENKLKSELALSKMELKALKAEVKSLKNTIDDLEFKLKNKNMENYRLNLKVKRAKETNDKLRDEKRAPLIELKHELKDVKADYNRVYEKLKGIVDEGFYE